MAGFEGMGPDQILVITGATELTTFDMNTSYFLDSRSQQPYLKFAGLYKPTAAAAMGAAG